MSINLPLYFIVSKVKLCVSESLGFGMLCNLGTVAKAFPLLAAGRLPRQGQGTCTQEERDRDELYRK